MTPEQQNLLTQLFAALPKEDGRRLTAAEELLKSFRREAATYLLPDVQAILRFPPDSYPEKQLVASRLNTLFHHFGLGIRHPEMEGVCGVNATHGEHGKTATTGWLRLAQRKRSDRGTFVRSPSTKNLDIDQIKLVDCPVQLPGDNLHRRG
jgi:hypothetical protein